MTEVAGHTMSFELKLKVIEMIKFKMMNIVSIIKQITLIHIITLLYKGYV